MQSYYREIVRISFLNCLSFLVMCANNEQTMLLYNSMTFDSSVALKPHFVMFFAPWCGHCKRLTSTWDDLSQIFNVERHGEEVMIAKVDCTLETALCSKHDVTGYPTLKFFNKGSEEGDKYTGSRDLAALKLFVDKRVLQDGQNQPEESIEAAGGAEEQWPPRLKDGLYELGTATFSKFIANGHHFVKFYVPWCGHCKRLSPIWEQLAKEFDGVDTVFISKLDCTLHTAVCQNLSVSAYPTLLFFRDGKQVMNYKGGRNLQDMTSYINDMRKTVEVLKQKTQAREGVIELSYDDFDIAISKGHHFVKFFAPWCDHCNLLAPTWSQLGREFKDDLSVTIAKLDCSKYEIICRQNNVAGYPAMFWFADGKKVAEFNGIRELSNLKDFVFQQKPRDEDEIVEDEKDVKRKEKEGEVFILTHATFNDAVMDGYTFVKFFAPYCVHCKRLAPTWTELGEKFVAYDNVKIAKVDCTAEGSLCSRQKIKAYPTLKLFHNGIILSQYEDSRELNLLFKFVLDQLPHDEL